MVARRRTNGIPEDLRVHVRVAIDKAGSHGLARGINSPAGARVNASNGRDFAVMDTEIRRIGRGAGAIDDHAILDD